MTIEKKKYIFTLLDKYFWVAACEMQMKLTQMCNSNLLVDNGREAGISENCFGL